MNAENIFFGAGEGVSRVHTELFKNVLQAISRAVQIAYEMVVVNHISHPSNCDELTMIDIEWFQGFMTRNDTLSIHTPGGCSLSRCTSFNKSNVNMFF
jgi:hypothetical protein